MMKMDGFREFSVEKRIKKRYGIWVVACFLSKNEQCNKKMLIRFGWIEQKCLHLNILVTNNSSFLKVFFG